MCGFPTFKLRWYHFHFRHSLASVMFGFGFLFFSFSLQALRSLTLFCQDVETVVDGSL